MNIYQKELQALKPWDEVQHMNEYGALRGYNKVYTAGHGYLVVPRKDANFKLAESICEYGFKGLHAVYLEEDCELGQFMDAIK
jgi:hypothetical protein